MNFSSFILISIKIKIKDKSQFRKVLFDMIKIKEEDWYRLIKDYS